MAFHAFLFFSLTHTAVGLQSSDHQMMATAIGRDVVLPCSIPDVRSCTSVSWNKSGELNSQVVSAGNVNPSNNHKLSLHWDCSLRISQVTNDDGQTYICSNGVQNANVSLYIVELNVGIASKEDTVELQCFLNTYKGYSSCLNRNIHIEWTWEDNTTIKGNRFKFENPSECFSKLLIHLKRTDHQRKWKCRLFQNNMLKAEISKTTTVQDGVEEVFAAIGEPVTLFCGGKYSSVTEERKVKWTENKHRLTGDMASQNGRPRVSEAFPSLVIGKVSALHAGEYQCSEFSTPERVINKIWLYTLDVASKCGRGGGRDLTLTCVLTCTRQCGEDFNLTWSGHGDSGMQSDPVKENNTLVSDLVLPSLPLDELTCLVLREGSVVMSKRWRRTSSLWTPAWLALPLILLLCTTAAGLYMWKKRRLHRNSGNEESATRMIPIYHEILDSTEEEKQLHKDSKVQTITTTDSFYDLLQAVH